MTWYFNGQLIESSPDFRISEDPKRGESVMTIVELFPDDEGEYMCKVENPLGTAVTHCHLFVQRKCMFQPYDLMTQVIKTIAVNTDILLPCGNSLVGSPCAHHWWLLYS